MDTTTLIPIETIVGQSYCITTDIPCTALAEVKGRLMPLVRVLKGQGIFIAPAETVYLTADALVTKSFKGAAPAVQGGGNNEIEMMPQGSAEGANCYMSNGSWQVAPGETTEVHIITNSLQAGCTASMVLEVKPEGVVMPDGWLHAQTEEGENVTVRWIAGEPTFPASGLTYIIGLTQRTPTLLLANLLATY